MNNAIKKQLEIQLTQKQLEEKLSDGKPHHVMHMMATFLDGESVELGIVRSITHEEIVTNFQEFDESMSAHSKALVQGFSNIDKADCLGMKAAAIAGMIVMQEILKGEDGCSQELVEDAACILAQVAHAENEIDLRMFLSWPESVKAKIHGFLERHPFESVRIRPEGEAK